MSRRRLAVLLAVLPLIGCGGPPDASSAAESYVKAKATADIGQHHPGEAGTYTDMLVLCGNAQSPDKTVYTCDVSLQSAIGTTNNRETWMAKSDSSGNIVSADLTKSDVGQ